MGAKSNSSPGGCREVKHQDKKILRSQQGFYLLQTLQHLARGNPTSHSNMSNYSLPHTLLELVVNRGPVLKPQGMWHAELPSSIPLKQPNFPGGGCEQQLGGTSPHVCPHSDFLSLLLPHRANPPKCIRASQYCQMHSSLNQNKSLQPRFHLAAVIKH